MYRVAVLAYVSNGQKIFKWSSKKIEFMFSFNITYGVKENTKRWILYDYVPLRFLFHIYYALLLLNFPSLLLPGFSTQRATEEEAYDQRKKKTEFLLN